MATREFNIDEVIAGAQIVQRSGESAKFVSYTPEAEEETVVWLDESDTLQLGYSSGGYFSEDLLENPSDRDLFIQVPDPPAPRKIVQSHTGTRTEQGKVYDMWYDTLWDNVKNARENFPNEIYREILVTA
jgi:hypothetical protein